MVHGLLIAVASLIAEHRLWGSWPSVAAACRLTSTVPKVVVLGLSYSSAGGNFLDLGSDSCLLHRQADSYPLHSQGSPRSVLFNFQKCRGALFYYQPITFLLLFNRCVVSNSSVTPWTVALTGSSVHRVSQARIPGWVTISFSRGSSQPRDWTMAGGFFTTKPPGMLPYFPCGHTKEYTQCDFISFIIFFLAARHNLWDLSSQSRDWTQALSSEKCRVLTTEPPGKSPILL